MSNEKPNFYMMPGDPIKKLDTPGSFSYKAESTMNKLGMGDAMANSGHADPAMNFGHPEDDKKKSKAPKLVVQTPSGPKAPRGPQSGTIGGVNVSLQTKGRSEQNTDLLEEGKKVYQKIKSYFSS